MLLVHLVQELPTALANLPVDHLPNYGSLWHFDFDWPLLAQQFDTDPFAGVRTTIFNFYKSGQLWALLIGVAIGYIIRGITTYN